MTDPLNRTTSYTYDANNNQLKTVAAGGMTNSYTYGNDRLTEINANNTVRYKLEYDALGRGTAVKVGNGTQYRQLSANEYNANGLLSRQQYGNGAYFTYTYDSLDRITEKRYNNSSQRVTYLYGSDGRPGQIIDYIANIRISPIYDLSGRLVTVKEYNSTVLHGNSLRSQADYTYADKTNYLTGVKYKSLLGTLNMSYVYGDMSLNQRPDAVYTVKMNNTEYLRYSYDALGRLSERTITPINKTQSYTYVQGDYGAKSTTTLVGSVTADGTVTSYQYDAAGNITAILKNGTVYESYEYDSLNQLTKVTCQNGDVYTYTYTGNGNLSEVKKNGTVIKSYGYTDSVWKDLLTAFNGQTITYDGIGNPLTYYDGRTFSWQNGRQLAGITDGETSISYTYNGDGIRTSKTVGGVTTTYILMDGRLLGEQSDGDSIVYLYDEAGEKYGFTYRNAWYYYRKNLQGDITGIYNANGELVTEYTYDAWGAPLTVTGSLADTIGQVNPIRYRGYYYDSESGLYYLQSRYYDPEVGRFINADGALAGVGESVQGYNLFAYCFNNPVNMADETGHWPQWLKDIGNAAKNILVKIANTVQAVFSASSAYIGGGVGVGASVQTTIGSLPVEVSAVAKTDIVSAEIGEGKIFHGITDESSLGANIAGVGPVLGKKRQHSFDNSDKCTCYPNESLFVRSLVVNDCPEWKTKIDDNHIKFSLGLSAYFAFGVSASVEYDFTYLYEEIIKIWRN